MSATRWQYMFISLAQISGREADKQKHLIDKLNVEGSKGWEVVTYDPQKLQYLLKRPS